MPPSLGHAADGPDRRQPHGGAAGHRLPTPFGSLVTRVVGGLAVWRSYPIHPGQIARDSDARRSGFDWLVLVNAGETSHTHRRRRFPLITK